MHISLIIPAYNEQDAITKVVEEALLFVDQVVIVDDGSTDQTAKISEELSKKYKKVKFVKHERNSGKVAALRTGIKNSNGNTIIFTDADFTYPASSIPEMTKALRDGADLVMGNRFAGEVKNIPLLNKIGNNLFSLLITYITGVTVQDGQTGMRAFLKKNFDKLDVDAKGLEYETKMTVKAAKSGYRIIEIPIHYRQRIGKSKLRPFADGWRMLKSLLSTAYTETSLLARMILMPSFGILALGVFFGLLFIYKYLTYNTIHPYYPLLSTLFIITATQLFSVGLILDNLYKKISLIKK